MTVRSEAAALSETDEVEGRRIRAAVAYLVAVVLYAGVVASWQAVPVPNDVYLAALLVAALCMLPLALWYARGRIGIPMFELICLSFGIQYSVPTFSHANGITINSTPFLFPWHDTYVALMLVSIGIGAMMVAYYTVRSLRWARALPSPRLALPSRRWSPFIYCSIVFGALLPSVLAKNFSSLGNLTTLVALQAQVGLALLAYQVYSGMDATWRKKVILYGSATVMALLGITGGLIENGFVPFAILLIVRWYLGGKFPMLWLVCGLLVFLVLNSAKHEYRTQMQLSGGQLSILGKLSLWSQATSDEVSNLLGNNGQSVSQQTVQDAASRTDLLHIFAMVHRMTPDNVPYYQGETYSYFLVAWVPRFLWPDKPSPSTASNQLARDYHLLGANDTTTSIGIGHLAEAYANFGLPGIIVVMGMEGAFFALLGLILNERGNILLQAIYLTILVGALNGIGSDTASFFGAIVQTVVGCVLIVRLAGSRSGCAEVGAGSSPPRPGPLDSRRIGGTRTHYADR